MAFTRRLFIARVNERWGAGTDRHLHMVSGPVPIRLNIAIPEKALAEDRPSRVSGMPSIFYPETIAAICCANGEYRDHEQESAHAGTSGYRS
jgi:hypothetical protein